MHAAPLPEALHGRPNLWKFVIHPPFGESFAPDRLVGTEPIRLPPGTHLSIQSAVARVESVVIEREDGTALYDTLNGVARPSVTAAIYRRRRGRIEVGVVFMKRQLGSIPSLRPLCDAHGFITCAEPPGGLVDDVRGHDFLIEVPSRRVLHRTVRREVAEEFGHVPIRSIRIRKWQLASLGIARGNVFQAFVELDPDAKPKLARPEDAEQIVGRAFLPLETVLARCLKGQHQGVCWGRESTHTWHLLASYLRRQDKQRATR